MEIESTDATGFGALLKQWRGRSNISQLNLALCCDVSQKHISFIEKGRTTPSREMVLIICEGLGIALRDRNLMLMAAGFAPVFKMTALDGTEMTQIDQAITLIIDNHDPLPALVVDRTFTIIRTNKAASHMLLFLFDVSSVEELPPCASNLMLLLFGKGGISCFIANWDEVAPFLLRQLIRECAMSDGDEKLRALLKEVEACPNLPPDWKNSWPLDILRPVLPMNIEKDGLALNLFSTITTLGTPLDITLQEIRIECFFPVDEATRQFFLNLDI